MFQIVAIKLSGTVPTLNTITDYLFAGQNGEGNFWYPKAQGVTYVKQNPNSVYVAGGGKSSYVDAVDGTPPYLRTRADGTTSDNLLSLPVY
jgi:hypothetical protein